MAAATEGGTAFSHEQFAEAYPPGIENHFWNVARNAILLDEIRAIEKTEGRPIGRMLEVGCGRGITVSYLRQAGYDCFGAELAPIEVPEELRAYLHSDTDCMTLGENFRQSVELILLLDVIEHIEDPVGFMRQLRLSYPRCQWLLVSVPARQELWSSWDDHYGHFRRYDPNMLRAEMTSAGIELISANYRFALLYIILRTFAFVGKSRSDSNQTPKSPMFHRLIGEVLRRERWFLPSRVYGSSLIGFGKVTAPTASQTV
jgi:hypothetical protein